MMRSMFSSVSGLKAHQTKMDVIGNNIANVNTVGFKSSRTTFQEIFSQTLSGAGAPNSDTGQGGTNPMQIGLGIGVGAVDSLMTSGSVQRTDSPTDLSIEGEGFFVLRAGDDDEYMFSRAGNFTIDKLGNLVNSSGMNVYGWVNYDRVDGQYEFDTSEAIQKINLYQDDVNKNKRVIAAQATTTAEFAGNLDAGETALDSAGDHTDLAPGDVSTDEGTYGYPLDSTSNPVDPQFIVPIKVYDKLGNEYKLNINMWKQYVDSTTDPSNPTTSWHWTLSNEDASSAIGDVATNFSAFSGTVVFDEDGNIVNDGTYPATKNITISPDASVGTDSFDVELDFTKLSMYAGESSVKSTDIDGYPSGTLVNFSIGADGIITGVYDNGRQQPLGMLGLAVFDNPAGLERAGSNMFVPTTNSGDFKKALAAGTEGAGALTPGTLEMSNVDLAKQFTDMIVTQRGFQANSRVMTTADEILQELANIKR